jgi:hypothetical protein
LAQQLLTKGDKHMTQVNPLRMEKQIPARTSIQLKKASNSGEWMKFSNWNEGNAVVAESDSIVWVGTFGGLVRWNVMTKTFQTFDETNALNGVSIRVMLTNVSIFILLGYQPSSVPKGSLRNESFQIQLRTKRRPRCRSRREESFIDLRTYLRRTSFMVC